VTYPTVDDIEQIIVGDHRFNIKNAEEADPNGPLTYNLQFINPSAGPANAYWSGSFQQASVAKAMGSHFVLTPNRDITDGHGNNNSGFLLPIGPGMLVVFRRARH
jgi:hypothetical protein